MVSPDPTRPPAGGYANVLDLIRTLSQCSCCDAFKQKLIQSLDTQYGLSVHLAEHPGRPVLLEQADLTRLEKASPEGVLGSHSLLLLGPCGWKLELVLDARQKGVETGQEILVQISQHLANLYHQYKVIELLEAVLKRIQTSHGSGAAANSPDLVNKLTPRERQIVANLIEGHGNAEISTDLGISLRTVEKHLENIFRKLHLENRYQLLTMIRHAPE